MCLPVTRMEGLLKFYCIPLPFTSQSKLGSAQPRSEKGWHHFKADPLPGCLQKVHFFPRPLFFPPAEVWVALGFLVLQQDLTDVFRLSNLHVELALVFGFPSSHPCFLLKSLSNSLEETRDQNAWGHLDMKFKWYYRKHLKRNAVSK